MKYGLTCPTCAQRITRTRVFDAYLEARGKDFAPFPCRCGVTLRLVRRKPGLKTVALLAPPVVALFGALALGRPAAILLSIPFAFAWAGLGIWFMPYFVDVARAD